jgi:hypothetical protein
VAASTFKWNGDGSATIIVNGHTYHVQANALTPGQPITVGGVKVGVPAKPAQPAPVLPFLDPTQQAQVNDSLNHFDELLSGAGLAKKQADIQLNQLDLPQINLRAAQQVEGTAEGMAGRGLSNSGIRDSALLDVERTRTMAETQARARFQSAQDAYDAANANVQAAQTRLNQWISTTSGENARAANADIPPVEGQTTKLSPYGGATGGAGAAPGPVNPAPAGPKPSYALPSISPDAHKPGQAYPGTPTSLPSGAPPGPNYVWTGNRWVKVGASQGAEHGLGPSGKAPGPNYYWNGVKWVKAAYDTGGAKLPKIKK